MNCAFSVQQYGLLDMMVWTGAENLAPTGIRSPDRPARSKSLYRLRYPAHLALYKIYKKVSGILLHVLKCRSDDDLTL